MNHFFWFLSLRLVMVFHSLAMRATEIPPTITIIIGSGTVRYTDATLLHLCTELYNHLVGLLIFFFNDSSINKYRNIISTLLAC